MTDREVLSDALARTLLAARLPRRERVEVSRELTAHFEDGLASGRTAADLLAEFGDPALAGGLIRRGARRRRRAHAPVLQAARLFSLAVLAAYAAAFARLHLGAPEAGPLENPSQREDLLAAWSPDTARRRGLESDALERLAAGDAAGASAVVREIAAGTDPGDDAAALRLAARLGLCDAGVAWSEAKVRTASERLLAAMYTGGEDGRLTADGLRLFQTWMGKPRPSAAAIALEPVYFPAPASRGAAMRELDRFIELARDARGDAFERELAKMRESRICSFRYVALRVPLEHLRLVRQGVRALEVHSSECP